MGGCGTIKAPSTDIFNTSFFFLIYHTNKKISLSFGNFCKL
ncbi:hypothetical protein ELI_2033 [Eubacterium callanderi]|uniref:Uncharacterized protein n=1 Tax=Eubacterium callanderi TaxID=53442 RepID=E3GDT6_9FIRM|nr:hypothetical protein ELI_2033 [Eubacterium callanderi]